MEGLGSLRRRVPPRRKFILVVLAAMVLSGSLVLSAPAHAGYAVKWFAVTGGGSGQAAGGPYSLRGAIGQALPGPHGGGVYALQGGFWVGVNGAYTVEVREPDETTHTTKPSSLAFHAPRPNPLYHSTVASFDLPADAFVRLRVYDPAGRLVRSLAEGTLGAGPHSRTWDGADARGRPVGAGIYFLRFECGAFRAQHRLVMLR